MMVIPSGQDMIFGSDRSDATCALCCGPATACREHKLPPRIRNMRKETQNGQMLYKHPTSMGKGTRLIKSGTEAAEHRLALIVCN